MKKAIIVILVILLISLSIIFALSKKDENVNQNKISVEEYQNESYFENITSYKIINNKRENDEKLVGNVKNEKDIESLINLLKETEKIEEYSYENEEYKFYMIAYLFDNSAIKIEGNKDEIKISSIDDLESYECYKLKIEDDIQDYFLRKFEKNVKIANYFVFKENEKFGVIDSYENIVILPEYDYIKIINNATDLFICTKENKIEIIDKNKNLYYQNVGEKITEIQVTNSEENIYSDILKYEINEKYGLINIKGEKVTDVEYDNISNLDYLKNYIVLEKEGEPKKLIKVNIDSYEILAEFDEIGIRKNNENTEYIIFGKNIDEEEQVINIEEIKNKANFPEILKEKYIRNYENGIYFYTEMIPEAIEKNIINENQI